MKPKKFSKNLDLNMKTIANLSESNLAGLRGGIEDTARNTCQTGVCAGTCLTCAWWCTTACDTIAAGGTGMCTNCAC